MLFLLIFLLKIEQPIEYMVINVLLEFLVCKGKNFSEI